MCVRASPTSGAAGFGGGRLHRARFRVCHIEAPSKGLFGSRPRAGCRDQTNPREAADADSGQGGLIGALITATSRASNLKDKMAGIQGETVKELILQELNRRLEKSFVLGEAAKDLKMDVYIDTWGWFVPTTVLGIKTGTYQCEVIGRTTITDLRQKNKKVAFVPVIVQKPLGNKPEEVAAKEAIIEAAQEFANRTVDFLVGYQNQTPKAEAAR